MKKYQKSRSKKKIFIILGVALVAVLVFGILEVSGKTNILLSQSSDKDTNDRSAKTTSKAPTAQEDFTEGNEREPSTPDRGGEGTVSDTGGNVSSPPPQNQWSTSPSGAITVYSPGRDTLITSGSTISGKATTPKVSFRLIDNVTGVIAQGELSVVNGNFSGTFNFSTTASTGRLDVFNTREDGVESNNVEVPIRFK